MVKNRKYYIPLATVKKGMANFTLINVRGVKALEELIPSFEDIILNLVNQKKRAERGKEYAPLRVKVSAEKFEEIEKQVKFKKPGHVFHIKAIDIISDTKTQLPIVQIIQV